MAKIHWFVDVLRVKNFIFPVNNTNCVLYLTLHIVCVERENVLSSMSHERGTMNDQ